MRENAYAKARRYLTEGRVIVSEVRPDQVSTLVRGDGKLYAAGYRGGEWSCDCPALSAACAHLRAIRMITAVDIEEEKPCSAI